MKKVLFCSAVLLALSFLLSGCENGLHIEAPEHPLIFTEYEHKDANGEGTLAFDYNNRTYTEYAFLDKLSKDEVESCIGFLYRNGIKSEDTWVLRLKAVENEDILILYFPDGVMRNPMICYRAIDTKGQTLELPDFLELSFTNPSVSDWWK